MPLSIILIPYALALFIFFFFSLVALYHVMRFGAKNFTTFFMTFLYIAVSALILFASFTSIMHYAWDVRLFEAITITLPTS